MKIRSHAYGASRISRSAIAKKQEEDGFTNRKAWREQTLLNEGWPTVILNTRAK